MQSGTSIRFISVLAASAIGLGLAACSGDESDSASGGSSDESTESAALTPQETIQAALQSMDDSSYQMDSTMTVDDADFVVMTTSVDGDNAQASGQILMSAVLEASGEEIDPSMESYYDDMNFETVVFDGTAYIQIFGGMYDTLTESYGEDVWFTVDLSDGSDMADIYSQFGGMDLASQTELMLEGLENVEETGDNTYTGTLAADSEALQTFTSDASEEEIAALEDTEVTVTLDDDGLLKSLSMTLPEIDGMVIGMTSEVTEIGGDYAIAAPESDNLVPFEEFMGSSE